MGLIAVAGAAVAGLVYLLRGGGARTALVDLGAAAGTIRLRSTAPVGNRGWLLFSMLGLGAELAHGLALTIGSVVIYTDPSLAGLRSFIPLWALLIYVVSNLGLAAYAVVLFVLMLRKRRAAIPNAILFNALSVAFLVTWFLLGAKSPIGTVVDALPWLAAIAYFRRSRRVRNTYTAM